MAAHSDAPGSGPAPGTSTVGTKACPLCGEEILAVATRCKHCKGELGGAVGAEPEREALPTSPLSVERPPEPRGSQLDPPAEVSIPGVLALSFVTLSIYGLLKFHEVVRWYQRRAGGDSTFGSLFGVYVGLIPVGVVISLLSGGTLAVVFWISLTVVGVLALREALRLRAAVFGLPDPRILLRKDASHLLMWGASSLPLVGIVPMIMETVFFFDEHQRLVALRGMRRSP